MPYFDFSNTPITKDTTLKAKWCGGNPDPVYEPKTDYLMLTFANGQKACVMSQAQANAVWQAGYNSHYMGLYVVNDDGSINPSSTTFDLYNTVRIDFGRYLTLIPDNTYAGSQALFYNIINKPITMGMIPPSVTSIGNNFLTLPNAHTLGVSNIIFDSGYLWIPSTVTSIGVYFLWSCNWATFTGLRMDAPFSVLQKNNSTDPNHVYDISSNTKQYMDDVGVNIRGAYAQQWADNLPNSVTNSPWRKLNVIS